MGTYWGVKETNETVKMSIKTIVNRSYSVDRSADRRCDIRTSLYDKVTYKRYIN